MAKKINKKQIDAVFGGKQKLSFESENRIMTFPDTSIEADNEKELYIDKIYNGKNKFFLSYKSEMTKEDNIQKAVFYNGNDSKDYPLTIEKVGVQEKVQSYTREIIHTYEIKGGFETYPSDIDFVNISLFKLKIKAPKQSKIHSISLIEVIEYPENKYRGGGYFDATTIDENEYEIIHKYFNNLGENIYNIKLPTEIGYVKPINENKTIKKVAGQIFLCTNDTDITLDLSQVEDREAFSVVKIGAGKVTFTRSGATFIGENEITGGQGSSASIIYYDSKVIVNLNNK